MRTRFLSNIRAALLAGFLVGPLAGCFSERSFTADFDKIQYVRNEAGGPPPSVRDWTRIVHSELEHLLPFEDRMMGPLTTEELTDENGKSVDVLAHFKKKKKYLHTFIGNAMGISHTAQVTGDTHCMDTPAPPWKGFEDIWVPINDHLKLSGRMGWSKKGGRIIAADCIVILPGLLGDNMRARARDIGQMLVESGHHVLALEFRGHGQTEAKYPDEAYSFGVLETVDMLTVAEWLESQPSITGTGIVSFSWSANISLLVAWENSRSDAHESVQPRLAPYLLKRNGKTYYQSGIFAVSPVLDLENVTNALDETWSMSANPIFNALQGTIDRRAERRGYKGVNGSLRKLIAGEYARSELDYPGAMDDGFDYLRFLPYKGHPTGRKLQDARVPILILHSASDPLAYAQEIADLFGETTNPRVAGIVLKGGGHDGFAAYCQDYFYSLILNFFDPKSGARQAIPKRMIAGQPVQTDDTRLIGEHPPTLTDK